MLIWLLLVWVLLLVTLKMIYVVLWEIYNACIGFGLVSDIARAYFSQLIFVHLLRSISFGMSIAGFRHVDSWGVSDHWTFGMSIAGIRHVDSWGVSEHWTTGDAYVRVICDKTGSRIGAGLIDRETTQIFFNSKNIVIHDVKQSVNISGYLVSSFICFHSDCSVSSGICPGCDLVDTS